MEKYGTYDVYRNKKTDEIIRIPFSQDSKKSKKGLEKIASSDEWEKLDKDPQDEEE